ncbi:MAG TPA: ABC transporter substrate-binding protein [Acidimicrobiales bacterium]|nr:ABC transporter substrate-binding protein [Acidimicrobiales bacterium]
MGKTTILRSVVLVTVLAFGAAACGNDSGSGTAKPSGTDTAQEPGNLFPAESVNKAVHDGTPVRGGTLTYGLEGDVLNVSPNQNVVQPPDVQLASAVFDPLISFDADGLPLTDNTDHQANQLADQLTHSKDLKIWTLTLRKGLKFSNGVALDAQQVVDNTNWVKESGTCDCSESAKLITDISATGADTVTYTLSEPVVDWPAKLDRSGLGWITESGARNAAADPSTPGIDNLVGAGPFKYQSKSGDNYTLVRNTNYYGVDHDNGDAKLPYLDKIIFKPLADSTTRLQAVQSDSVQIMQTADTANLVQAKKDSKLSVQPAQGSSSTIIGLNLNRPPFGVDADEGESPQAAAERGLDDPTALEARQAFNYSINRNEINQKDFSGTRNPAYGFLPADSPFYDAKGQLPRFDLAKAKSLVQKVKQSGVSTDLTALCVSNPQATSTFQLVQQQVQAAGFTATLKQVEQAVLVQNLLAGGGDIAWNLACFRAPQLADPNGLYNALHSGGPTNFVKYSRTDVDDALDQGRRTADRAERQKLYATVQQQVSTDVVYVPLLFDYYGNVFRNNVSGLTTPSPTSLGIIRPGNLFYTEG